MSKLRSKLKLRRNSFRTFGVCSEAVRSLLLLWFLNASALSGNALISEIDCCMQSDENLISCILCRTFEFRFRFRFRFSWTDWHWSRQKSNDTVAVLLPGMSKDFRDSGEWLVAIASSMKRLISTRTSRKSRRSCFKNFHRKSDKFGFCHPRSLNKSVDKYIGK